MIEDLWYKNTVIYGLDLETYMDQNGDGTGDFEGLTRRLDYLHGLGIDTIWLAPFQLTPNGDNGYDIKDYYSVDPRHGSLGLFAEFMHQAKKRGIKVILDLVVNHTSIEHSWFQRAREDENSPFRNWYVWSKEKPKDWDKGMVFPGVQKATWTWDDKAKAYYHHRFYEFQPDLNFDNPEVREEIRRVMGFWLELGIAGFRVDGVPFILESRNGGSTDVKTKFEYLHEMRRFLQWRSRDAIMLGEANIKPKDVQKYFGDEGDGMHMMFNFYVNQYLFYALATADVEPLKEALEATRVNVPTAQWAHFLRNHDELDIGRLKEEEKKKVFERFGPEENMQLYDRGIRRRLASMLGDRKLIELAYSLMFSLPGTPVIRYGDEIGMGEDLSLDQRAAVRTPMQWSGDKNSGFSNADKVVHPVIDKGDYGYKKVNVELERRQPDSLLNWMTSMIRLRHECAAIGYGEWKIVKSNVSHLLCMHYTWQEKSLLIVHNFDNKSYDFTIDGKEAKSKLIDLLQVAEIKADEKGDYNIPMQPYGYRWFKFAEDKVGR